MSNQDADFREVDSELDKARLLRQVSARQAHPRLKVVLASCPV